MIKDLKVTSQDLPNKIFLGQVWTPEFIVQKMLALISIKEPELILECSSGTGNFYFPLKKQYRNVIGIELDQQIAHKDALIKSYFETNFQPDVIIGNPPYVEFKLIQNKPQSQLLIHKPNLFHFFLEKALKDLKPHGELIWIIPGNIFTNTSSRALNEIINQNYSITHWEPMAENVWPNASVPTAIVKLVKTINHPEKLKTFFAHGKIIFGQPIEWNHKLVIKVGAACGFKNQLQPGPTEFVVSQTERNQQTIKITYQPQKWIRPTPKAPNGFTYQIFVNSKTRKAQPFYMLQKLAKGQFVHYDAAVLCIYTFNSKASAVVLMNELNRYDWIKAGIKKDGRFHFSQSILQAVITNQFLN